MLIVWLLLHKIESYRLEFASSIRVMFTGNCYRTHYPKSSFHYKILSYICVRIVFVIIDINYIAIPTKNLPFLITPGNCFSNNRSIFSRCIDVTELLSELQVYIIVMYGLDRQIDWYMDGLCNYHIHFSIKTPKFNHFEFFFFDRVEFTGYTQLPFK